MADNEILTLDELSKYLKIPKGTIYKMCQSTKMPSFKAGKQLRFRKSAIDKWVINQEKKRKRRKTATSRKKFLTIEFFKKDIKKIMSKIARVKISKISDEVNIRDDLGVDSLQAVEILVAIEQKYGIQIDEARAFNIITFADLIELAKEYIKKSV